MPGAAGGSAAERAFALATGRFLTIAGPEPDVRAASRALEIRLAEPTDP